MILKDTMEEDKMREFLHEINVIRFLAAKFIEAYE